MMCAALSQISAKKWKPTPRASWQWITLSDRTSRKRFGYLLRHPGCRTSPRRKKRCFTPPNTPSSSQNSRTCRASSTLSKRRVANPKSGASRVTTAAYLDKLLDIVRSYPLEVEEPEFDAPDRPVDYSGFEPHIILSESFTPA